MKKQIAEQLDTALAEALDGQAADSDRSVSGEVEELVNTAQTVRRGVAQAAAAPAREEQALAEMRSALLDAKQQRAAAPVGLSWRPLAAIAGLWPRQALAQAATVLGAVVITGAALIGASAAGADIAPPLTALFDSKSEVKVRGVVAEIGTGNFIVETDGELFVVTVSDDTEIEGVNGEQVGLDALAVGQAIEIKGTHDDAGNIAAVLIRLEE